jgi:DNA-binding SARP family transcriptional activator
MSAMDNGNMKLRLFGPFVAAVGGDELPGLRDHRKAMHLLALLALYPNRALGNEWIAGILWPETGSVDSLGHTVPVLRKALGPHSGCLVARSGSLLLDMRGANVDIEQFQEIWERRTDEDADLKAAVDLYNGALLQDWQEPWVEPYRISYRDKYLEILHLAVRAACRRGDIPGARRYLRRLVAEGEPANDLHVRLMELLVKGENYLQASSLYTEYRTSLRASLAAKPPPKMTELYGRIPREQTEFVPEIPEDYGCIEPVGGAMPLDSRLYIRRAEDGPFHAAVARSDGIICVKGPRQVGKSSLLARGLEQARQAGARVVVTDFQTIEPAGKQSLETFYLMLANAIADQLGLTRSPSEEWSAMLAPGANFERFLRREAFADAGTAVVWAIDEADAIFDCDFRSSVFGLFRSWYNARVLNASSLWSRFSLILVYSTEAHLFITNLNQSPFNVGTRITLRDFTLEQVGEINERYGSPCASEVEVRALFEWMGGHPFLTRLCLYEMNAHAQTLADLRAASDQEDGVFGEHLDRVRLGITGDAALGVAIRDVLRGSMPISPESYLRLRAGGILAGGSNRDARFRCELYREYLGRVLQ